MADEALPFCDLLGFVGKWLEEKSFPMAKVEYKGTIVEGQVSIERFIVPNYIPKALPTEINVNGEEISLRSIKAIEMEGTRYVIKENNE